MLIVGGGVDSDRGIDDEEEKGADSGGVDSDRRVDEEKGADSGGGVDSDRRVDEEKGADSGGGGVGIGGGVRRGMRVLIVWG